MSNLEGTGPISKKTYRVREETDDRLNQLAYKFGFSSRGRVIDYLVDQEFEKDASVNKRLEEIAHMLKVILNAVDNDNDQLVALTEVINNIALAKLWPTDFVSMKVNTHPLFTAAEAEAKKKRIEKIKSAQYRLKR